MNIVSRNIFAIALLLFLGVVLSGCMEKVRSETEIYQDIKDRFSENHMTFESMSIIKRQSTKEDKKDIVYCEVVLNDTKVQYLRKYILIYNYNNEGGWVLEKVDSYDTSTWTKKPLIGVPDSEINALLEKNKKSILPLDTNYDEITIEHKTDLTNFVDNVTVNLKKNSSYYKISGSVNLRYFFDEKMGVWKFDTSTKNADYKEELLLTGKWIAFSGGMFIGDNPHYENFSIEIQSVDNSGNVIAVITDKSPLDEKIRVIKATGTYDYAIKKLAIKSDEEVYMEGYGFFKGLQTVRFSGKIDIESGVLSGTYVWEKTLYGINIKLKK